jgi:uncharacterized protein (DUF2236 family)
MEGAANAFLYPPHGRTVDFMRPLHEEALICANSVSWQIFKNPIALFVGGVAAVILELAEPAVRTGVWEHSRFRQDPIGRIQRTGLAAMITVYGARSVAVPMIARVCRMHAAVQGETIAGMPYSAQDPGLLTWVQSTAAYGIAQAYSRYVNVLRPDEFDALYRESAPASRLYGAHGAPTSASEIEALFETMRRRLEPSPIVFEFLRIMREKTALPSPLQWLQPVLVRAAVEIVPAWIRERLGLTEGCGLAPHERWLVRRAGNLANRIILVESPPARSCRRLGLSMSHLYAEV